MTVDFSAVTGKASQKGHEFNDIVPLHNADKEGKGGYANVLFAEAMAARSRMSAEMAMRRTVIWVHTRTAPASSKSTPAASRTSGRPCGTAGCEPSRCPAAEASSELSCLHMCWIADVPKTCGLRGPERQVWRLGPRSYISEARHGARMRNPPPGSGGLNCCDRWSGACLPDRMGAEPDRSYADQSMTFRL